MFSDIDSNESRIKGLQTELDEALELKDQLSEKLKAHLKSHKEQKKSEEKEATSSTSTSTSTSTADISNIYLDNITISHEIGSGDGVLLSVY
jgi:hypothetical protein